MEEREQIGILREDYWRSYWIYERLERDTFDSSNVESEEDAATRLYEQGYSDALAKAIRLLGGEL